MVRVHREFGRSFDELEKIFEFTSSFFAGQGIDDRHKLAAEFAIEHDDDRSVGPGDAADESVAHEWQSVVAGRGVADAVTVAEGRHPAAPIDGAYSSITASDSARHPASADDPHSSKGRSARATRERSTSGSIQNIVPEPPK